MRILVSGATGYVGSRLIPRLVASGHEVSCMVRDPSRVARRFAESTRLVVADPLQPESLAAAMQGIDVAYYLIHSTSASGGDFQQRDWRAAQLCRGGPPGKSEPDHLSGRACVRNLTNFLAPEESP